jgi:6,7-dimethyl-8-ribityllumazine synthase
MLRAAKAELMRARAAGVQVIRVPGAFEIPVVAARLAALSHAPRITRHASRITPLSRRSPTKEDHSSLSAIICLGVILRGETVHAAHIGEAVSSALMEIQLRYEVPVIHEVLLLENEAQARARCLDRRHNRGAEAAQTALAMAEVMRRMTNSE